VALKTGVLERVGVWVIVGVRVLVFVPVFVGVCVTVLTVVAVAVPPDVGADVPPLPEDVELGRVVGDRTVVGVAVKTGGFWTS
jgi:hypothetical protein